MRRVSAACWEVRRGSLRSLYSTSKLMGGEGNNLILQDLWKVQFAS
jgi:hypothetical protein